MKPLSLLVVAAALLSMASCRKQSNNSPTIKPVAAFSLQLGYNHPDSADAFVCPTGSVLKTINSSSDAEEFVWSIGGGQMHAEKEPLLVFNEPGDYSVILTASTNGVNDTSVKTVRVVDRLIKRVTMTALNWNASFADVLGWDAEEEARVFVRIFQRDAPGLPGLNNQQYDAEKIYESAGQLMRPADVPVTFEITEPVVLLPPGDARNIGYCLYAEKRGREYLLLSNWGSNFSGTLRDDLTKRSSTYELAFNGTDIVADAQW